MSKSTLPLTPTNSKPYGIFFGLEDKQTPLELNGTTKASTLSEYTSSVAVSTKLNLTATELSNPLVNQSLMNTNRNSPHLDTTNKLLIDTLRVTTTIQKVSFI